MKPLSPAGHGEAAAVATPPVARPVQGDNIVIASVSVVDDLPDVVPVTVPELDAIETYLGGLIDQLLTDAKASECTIQAVRPPTSGTPSRLPALDRD